MIGQTMTPMPQIDIAFACRSGGLMSIITVWESGGIKAPQMPWSRRNATISSRLVAMPQSIDAMMKPLTATRQRFREPNRPESQPVIGVASAAATLYQVKESEERRVGEGGCR